MNTPDANASFLQRTDQLMTSVLSKLDSLDPDQLEADLSMGVLRISFADGRKCILNRQTAAHQIWLAEGASAWHFAFDEASRSWLDTKGRGELRAILGGVIAQKLGKPFGL